MTSVDPVIDAHAHLAPASRVFAREASKTGAQNTLEGLLAEMDATGVERAVVIGHYDAADGRRNAPFRNRSNNDLLELLPAAAGRLRGLLSVNIDRDGVADLELLEEHLRRPDIVGVKVWTGYESFYADDARLEPLWEVLGRRRKVALIHTGDTLDPDASLKHAHPLPVDAVAVAHRNVRFVLAHAGQHWMHDAGEVVGKNENVWADISGWFLGDRLPWFTEYVKSQMGDLIFWADSADRLMFGTDWPLMRMAPYREFVEGCDFIPEAERRKILYRNAQRLYWDG